MPLYKRNIIVLSCTIFLASVSWNQIVPFLPKFLEEIGAKGSLYQWTGFIFSLQSVAAIICAPLWGKFGDSYGRKLMTIRAGVFLCAIYFAVSYCQAPWQLAALRFLNGALTGFIPGSIALIATNTPSDRVARYVATGQSFQAAGQVAGPAIGGFLAMALTYRGSMRASGVAILVSVLLVLIFVREPNKTRDHSHTSLIQDFVFAVRSPLIAALMFGTMMQGFLLMSISPFVVLHVRDLSPHGSDLVAGAIYAFPAVALLLTAQPWSRTGERIGHEQVIRAGLIGGAVICALLVFARNIWLFAGVYLLTGASIAAVQVCCAALTCRKVPETFRGRAFGMQTSAGVVGACVAPLASGFIAGIWGVYAIFAMASVVLGSGAVAFSILASRARKDFQQ